jgi:hypothetical protein
MVSSLEIIKGIRFSDSSHHNAWFHPWKPQKTLDSMTTPCTWTITPSLEIITDNMFYDSFILDNSSTLEIIKISFHDSSHPDKRFHL